MKILGTQEVRDNLLDFAKEPAHEAKVAKTQHHSCVNFRPAQLGKLRERGETNGNGVKGSSFGCKTRLVVVSHTKRVPKNCLFLEPTQGNKNDPQNARNQ